MIKKMRQFFSDVQFEMGKVSWPTWDELKGSTYVVISVSLLIGVFLFFIDIILSRIMNVIL
ncbi:MAG TPA: preprotein translocase subunit SecE [Candidatus Marinimicrobia bacterium]|jgi:preprotein translocase subunit SecE|nr:preprotein translocase subunit SecE [Candidatus Neomarinimicrobiota bacterium]MDP6276435.1 preprotein translocase subunit SecE [Candidatus Neomarinimicrobiota bacterium]MDP7436855.1 preprotein translocase subunit SecE [Candidatus Neomarinimicrobiota bacterium]HBN45141.1 preprotein translocase subunit SecE [Candidatus Neomarinimicrobiota bacterium]HJL74236.1 preprotein translocase subunit SecE [Candidatus Neomarinimicrobiota bacterium]|tara:strand:- start:13980 stop:14162 length:183 start_codon:yes stop_codon:yes gene_type:complete